jgi:hypothetical protein
VRIKLKEADVVKAVVDYVNTLPGFWIWRRNVGAMSGTHNGKTRFIRFGKKGMADWEGIGPKGVHLEIEIKQPGKLPTSEQIAWMQDCQSKGAIAFYCDSIEMCERQLKFFGLITKGQFI